MIARPIVRSVTRPVARRVGSRGTGGSVVPSNAIGANAIGAYAFRQQWLDIDGRTVLDQRSGLGDTRPLQPGRALELNGSTRYVSVDSLVPNESSDLTIALRFKMDDLVGTKYLASCGVTSSSLDLGWSIVLIDDLLCLRVSDGTNRAGVSVTLTETGWHSLVMKVNRTSGAVEGLLNGSSAGFVGGGGGPSSSDLSSVGSLGTRSLFLGASLAEDNHAGGLFSDFSFATRAWSDLECDAYCAQGTTSRNKLVAGYPTDHVIGYNLDNNSTTQELNTGSLGSAYNGTVINGSTGMLYTGSDVPWSPQNLIGYTTVWEGDL